MKDGKRNVDARKARLAEKLRENLRRRKEQMRGRREEAARAASGPGEDGAVSGETMQPSGKPSEDSGA